MFTGIVEELGEVAAVQRGGGGALIRIRGEVVAKDVRHGDSIAVSGVCLTVAALDTGGTGDGTGDGGTFTADVMAETLDRTALGALVPGDPVNLERAVTPQTRLGGHLVQGHVDGVGRIVERAPGDPAELVGIALPPGLARYVAEKGSIAVDGVSLTVTGAAADHFAVGLIPTTLALTTLGRKGPGDAVNLEVDVIAKYVERLLEVRS
ncbi:MAG: riboflavin synthase [Streptomycetales bacterium]